MSLIVLVPPILLKTANSTKQHALKLQNKVHTLYIAFEVTPTSAAPSLPSWVCWSLFFTVHHPSASLSTTTVRAQDAASQGRDGEA